MLQYGDRVRVVGTKKLDGPLVQETDLAPFAAFPLLLAVWRLFRFRLALLFDDDTEEVLQAGVNALDVLDGLVFGVEWTFLRAITDVLAGANIDGAIASLALCDYCKLRKDA